jgi:hypothetical protein
MSYVPARSANPINVGRTDCPLIVFRSHPDFPNTLAPEVDGAWSGTNPAWPDATVDLILDQLQPPCHTDWKEFKHEIMEERDGLKASIVYVKPGPRTRQSLAGPVPPTQSEEDGPPCSTCGTVMKRSGLCYKCPSCGSTTGCI